jgi:terminase small subunit-like protein
MARGKPSTIGGFDKIRHPKKRAFLGRYAESANVRQACEAVGINRQTHYNWLKSDPDYAEAFERAKDEAADRLEELARSRASAGSDTLLIFLLKGARPDVYRERYEHSGPGGGPIPHEARIIILPEKDTGP